ncbi:hypothetical protein WICANDRAFT_85261 [Wickerhamomyces anomalus NRRL Y-366-8]|uniref:REJ domain-containing protein n=1 Tax=Wickerhamomyces anomalus (strain ATCC 58044 / CBS 1984 / NCYC 433 / NRRL Y-366-8) TaxID=683960 RepID=A0A1E3NYF8_WICAA|nr:uncharacterized protein WICANDRAFT_85261 [Wickerhamomyces anomalus NRRL Y-366-8]ODQ58153.1 hypothetical protein WICANDRAFT_85261 [Wickerhamomyces anomalus NRRL Y-366-8]
MLFSVYFTILLSTIIAAVNGSPISLPSPSPSSTSVSTKPSTSASLTLSSLSTTTTLQPTKFPTLSIQQPVLSSNSNQFFTAVVIDKRQLN